jgi:hypothetical protein
MITDSLPYLMQLIKSNIILHTLVVSGNWHHINLGKYEHEVLGQTLIIKDFPLSNADTFEVNFSVQDDIFSPETKGKIIALSLVTRESKYFDASDFYFNDDENRGKNKNPLVKEERKFSKDLGVFKIYDDAVAPAFVAITQNPNYGYMIYIRFYTNFDVRYKIKRELDEGLEKSADWKEN